jgi:hypothetical protein
MASGRKEIWQAAGVVALMVVVMVAVMIVARRYS